MTPDDEAPLVGGWVSEGIVRVGNTVRRPAGANSNFVARLLVHLADTRFGGAPQFLGYDDHGREVLTFIQGDLPSDCRSIVWTDHQLAASARLLRSFHDWTAGSELAEDAEVVCHNDYGPWNLIWRNEEPVAIIDFDRAAPGTRLDDLGYAAWKHLNLGLVELTVPEQRHRLNVLAGAYGCQTGPLLLEALVDAAQSRMSALAVREGWTREAVVQLDRERAWLARHAEQLFG